MGFIGWVAGNWFAFLQSLGIIASLVFAGATFRADTKSRRVANLMKLTSGHREIWNELERRPELSRILETSLDLKSKPVTPEEERFIRTLVLHLNTAYQAMKDGVFTEPEGLGKDIRRFFARPVAKVVWEAVKPIQDSDFVQFVEGFLDD